MTLAKFLEPARVLANVDARSRKHALEILSELIAGSSESLAQTDVLQALLKRERIGNTGLGKGVAIPHGSIEGQEQSVGAFLKLNEAVDFGAQDDEPVGLIFAVLVPTPGKGDHFEDVAEIAKALSDAALIEELTEATGSRAVYDLLCAYQPGEPAAGTGSAAEEVSGAVPDADGPP